MGFDKKVCKELGEEVQVILREALKDSGFDISVNHVLVVGIVQGFTHLRSNFYGLDNGKGDPGRKGGALDQLHDHVELGILFAKVMNHDDMGMGQLRQQPGFPLKARADVALCGQLDRQELDGDFSVEAPVTSAKDGAHSAMAQLFKYFEVFVQGHGWNVCFEQTPGAHRDVFPQIDGPASGTIIGHESPLITCSLLHHLMTTS